VAAPPRVRRPRSIREDAFNLPNLLTMLRIVLIPLVLYFLAQGTPRSNFWAMVVYIVSAATDFLDGYLARKRGLISVLGKFLDPLADKLLVMGTLVFMVYLDRLPLWGAVAVIVILGRELTVTALRTIAMSEGVVIAARQGGKEKTALQMVAIPLLIMQHRYTLDFFFFSLSANLTEVGVTVLYLSLIFALTSGGEYFALFVEAVEAKERRLREEDAEASSVADAEGAGEPTTDAPAAEPSADTPR